MVNVTHNGHDRRAWLQDFRRIIITTKANFNIRFRYTLNPVPKFTSHQFSRFTINGLCCCCHDVQLHQLFYHIGSALGHPVCQFTYCNAVRNNHITKLFDLRLFFAHPRPLTLALDRSKRALTTAVITRQSLCNGHFT